MVRIFHFVACSFRLLLQTLGYGELQTALGRYWSARPRVRELLLITERLFG
jgi:hypothetical protein